MHLSQTLTAPNGTYSSIWSLMTTAGVVDPRGFRLVSGTLDGSIVPIVGNQLDIQASQGNSGTITISDDYNAVSTDAGTVLYAGYGLSKNSNNNTISLGQYFVKGSAASQTFVIDFESK